ncbi:SDR family NAD(P)-dependent oxidoreductase [Thermodesulfobacteriota bacterium]
MKDLKGKNAILTGATGGLGRAMARTLAAEGVNLALAARTEAPLAAMAEELASSGIRAVAVPADITDKASRTKLVEETRTELGEIDILVNNAGMDLACHFTNLAPATIDRFVTTNLSAPMLLTRLILPDMIRRGSGHVVTLASLGGKKGSPGSATYSATKAGLIEWTSSIRSELRGTGVSASVICPGFVSGAGMFATHNRRAPKIVGETTPEKVAGAVVRAVKKDVQEIIVNPGPVMPLMILNTIHPGIGNWMLRKFGVHDFYRLLAEDDETRIREMEGESTV